MLSHFGVKEQRVRVLFISFIYQALPLHPVRTRSQLPKLAGLLVKFIRSLKGKVQNAFVTE